ncbi:MAG: hypothetical protein GQ569_09655 [Methylococcaceae bacterium]|nr:hypothetical protein [Methylococcaceae bacterium]
MNLSQGQNTPITAHQLKILLSDSNRSSALTTDLSIFLLNADNKVTKDEDFVFFNNPNRNDVGVIHNLQAGDTDINLTKVPATISKIVFALTISDGVAKKQSFKDVSAAQLKIVDNNNAEVALFAMDTSTRTETALIMGEFYRRNEQWKFRAIGQGFNGGLQPLAELYGVDIGEGESNEASSETPPPTQTQAAPKPSAPPPPRATNPINLEKRGEKTTISLNKGAKVTAKLQWETNADLDLYCFYVDDSGKEDKVYYRKLGSLNSAPYIQLMGDSQTAGEEVVEISKPEKISYALIAAYSALSNGVGSFYSYQAKCVISDNQGQTVTTHLAHDDAYSYWVALARISYANNQLTIENVETYSSKKNFIAEFERRTGSKPSGLFKKNTAEINGVNSYDAERSPHLFKDGTFMMSVGVREFKK